VPDSGAHPVRGRPALALVVGRTPVVGASWRKDAAVETAKEPIALTLADYQRLSRSRMDPGVWDFIAGGAGEESTLAANTAAYSALRLRPGS